MPNISKKNWINKSFQNLSQNLPVPTSKSIGYLTNLICLLKADIICLHLMKAANWDKGFLGSDWSGLDFTRTSFKNVHQSKQKWDKRIDLKLIN